MSLTVQGVGRRFGLTDVLSGIDLALAPGEAVALVGPSGCGKTTLLHLIAGLETASEGRIDNGFGNPAHVFQQPRLLPWKTARDNIALGLKARGVAHSERDARAGAIARRLGLSDDDLDKFPHQLSGGMQSRVALARAFVLEPDLLLLDEPFSALDIGLKAELYALLLKELAQRGASLLMITHDLMEAVRLTDRILMMAPETGRIVGAFRLDQPRLGRSEEWIYRTTAAFMEAPAVREGFGLPTAAAADEATEEATKKAVPIQFVQLPPTDAMASCCGSLKPKAHACGKH